MSDIKCPYCGADQDICHDDGHGYSEERHEDECSECERPFYFYTQTTFHYEAFQAPCLNGCPHRWEESRMMCAQGFPDAIRCQTCGENDLGHYKPDLVECRMVQDE